MSVARIRTGEGGGGEIGVCKSADTFINQIRSSIFARNPKSGPKK